jgi:hypothetical protein
MTLSSQPIPVADLLTRAAHEIGLCRAVEHAVEHLHDQGSYPDLQGLDLLDQMLGDIAALLRAIAETNAFAPAVIEDAEPLLASLRLGAVRARLRNVHTDASHLRREHHVEIF